MKFQAAIALIAVASMANALSDAQTAELNAILSDVQNHLSDYMGLATSGQISLSDLPAGVLNLGMAIAQGKETSALYNSVDMDAVQTWLPALPWYSTRLSSEIDVALYTITHTSAAAQTSETTSAKTSAATTPATSEASSAAVAASSAAVAASSSAAAGTASVTAAASSAAVAASSSAIAAVESESVVSSAVSNNSTSAATSSAIVGGNTTITATSTRMHTSTICTENCPITTSTGASAFQNSTTTITECDEVCHSSKSAAMTTISSLTTVTSTHCDEVCHSSKSAAASAGANGKTTVTQVATISAASTAQGVHVQTENNAAKKVAGLTAAVLGAVALLL
ncbi:similar to hypothetical protein NDAI_0E03650 [Naumovozyma dairenensis CBS 421] [Maudiozyma barnettii]|uniref:Uncharacterized protein n=1 Tax=Maudiozyma barnettii TaxID=61262 RepID=A0A8H2ZGN4_9SACH|nr:similar to hypothetical protein NDAI_0E03650 [Naumovozyma dairenensis CBS 421] [Kazachstania barnettii]CAB4254784.1 similar to hypothetical protein NDAI_0E03650 [Naumovozyma dairenensis CBS 421] [Kazachstania barnettii]CAD1782931.1 similar to hypothetical protein NDAI_0E03650 [Naumovozyma dairenensis CBS 421] [Kazachstania barnettii]